MNRILQCALALTLLAAALALAGCPKTSIPASGGTAAGAGLAGPAGGAPGGPAAPGASPAAGAGGSGASADLTRPGSLAAGTMAPALPAPGEYAEHHALADIHFDFDRYEIRAEDRLVLQKNADWLKAHRGAPLLIEGHADERGTNEYNLALGERRASVTRDYLATLGIDRGRLTIITYGEERPLCTERHETCWGQNRRAHFLVRP